MQPLIYNNNNGATGYFPDVNRNYFYYVFVSGCGEQFRIVMMSLDWKIRSNNRAFRDTHAWIFGSLGT